MSVFKTASRKPEDLQKAKDELDDIFSMVKNRNKTLNHKGVKELDNNRVEIAELIITLIEDTVAVQDPTPFLVDAQQGNLGDEFIWQELDSTLRVVNRAYGTKPLSQRLVFREFGISTTMKEVAVEIPLEEVAIGRVTPSMVTNAVSEAIIRNRITQILDGIDAGVSAGADHSGVTGFNLRYTGFTKANFDNAIDGLQDESEGATIFGRHVSLAPAVRNFVGYSDETQRDLDVRGMIGTYHGATLVSLRDKYHKQEAGHVIRNDRLYCASGQKGAIFMTRDVAFLDWSIVDPRTSTFGLGTRLEDGLLVTDPYQYRILTRS